MNNLRKLENLFRLASGKVGSEDTPSKEEDLVFHVLDKAFDSEEFKDETAIRLEEGSPRRNLKTVILRSGAVAACAFLVIAVYFGSTAAFHRQMLRIANAANEEGDLLSLLASVRNIASLHLSLTSPLRELVQKLEDQPLNSIGQSLLRGEDYAALEAAAAEIASLRKAEARSSAEMRETQALLSRYLIRQTNTRHAHQRQRVYSLILIARLFLENPVDSLPEISDSLIFRTRLESILKNPAVEKSREELLYAISALSCCGTFKSAVLLSERLKASEPDTEERRLLLVALERIHRRSYLCPELDDIGQGRDWLGNILVAASRDERSTDTNTTLLLRGWLEFERRFGNGAIAEEIRRKFASADELNPSSLLTAGSTEQESREQEFTYFSKDTLAKDLLAHWDFSTTEFAHSGSAEPAKGSFITTFKDRESNSGHLLLKAFGRSKVVFPFTLNEIPEVGITLRIKQLAAARNYLAYQGAAQIAVLLDGKAIAENFTITRHGLPGAAAWDSFFIARHYLNRGRHELEIQLSRESTTTHWLYEASVEGVEVR